MSDIARFKQEYEVIKTIGFDGVVKTIEVIQAGDEFTLVQEDSAEVSIKDLLRWRRFDARLFIEAGIQISEPIGNLHNMEIIHNDIKRMGGGIWAESEGDGKGAAFVLKLPLFSG